MNFHETVIGKRFFESQLPQLIKSLQSISEKMTSPVPAVQLPVEVDPDFLRKLYLHSHVFDLTASSQAVIEAQAKFLPHLSDADRAAFDDYEAAAEKRSEESAERAYQIGFQTAVQMIVCGLSMCREETAND